MFLSRFPGFRSQTDASAVEDGSDSFGTLLMADGINRIVPLGVPSVLCGENVFSAPPRAYSVWRQHAVLVEVGLAACQSFVYKCADARDGACRLRHERRESVPDMGHARPDLECHGAATCTQFVRHSRGIIAQDFVASDLQQNRRQTAWVAVERRDMGMAGIRAPEILGGKGFQTIRFQHRVGRIIPAGFTGDREIRPGRDGHNRPWQWQAFVAEPQRQSERKATPRRNRSALRNGRD